MKLLFDHNLSHRIVPLLADLFEAAHCRHLGMQGQTADATIFEFAKLNGYTIIGADRDFLNLANSHGAPPQVIWLEAMDYGMEAAAALIRKYALAITEFSQSSRAILILRKEN